MHSVYWIGFALMDYTRPLSLPSLCAAFDDVHPAFCETPEHHESGVQRSGIGVIRFGLVRLEPSSGLAAYRLLSTEQYVPVRLEELVCFADAHPDLQQQCDIVGVGSFVVRYGQHRHYPVLRGGYRGTERSLGAYVGARYWAPMTHPLRFLVRDVEMFDEG